MTPVSTWAVFIYGVLKTTGIDTSHGQIGTHIKIMPFMIYPIISIIGTVLMISGLAPRVFRLKRAYDNFKAREDQEISVKGNPLNFVIPIVILIVVTVLTLNITYGLVTALVVTTAWLSFSEQVYFKEAVDIVLKGMSTMTSPLIFIIFAFTFGEILTELGFADTVLNLINPLITRENLLVFSFLLVAGLVFAGIDVWATIPLILPVLLPLAQVHEVNAFMVIGAILSGISFGTQVCFISESNILVSGTLGLKPVNQVLALMPYALTYVALTSLIFLYLGYTM
nr:Na+/H+ antiporter NhaC family protein [Acidaminobacter sp. JC074]